MRINIVSLALGTVLAVGLSGVVSLGQEQNQAPDANSAPPAASQNPSTNTPRHHRPSPALQTSFMAKKLGLTPDQQAQLEPILAERQHELRSVRSDSTLAQQDRVAKVRGIRQDSNNKIEAILNDTQKQQFEQMKQERRAHRQQHSQEQSDSPSNS
jgi:periplasmic protein CpxP/Spy